MKSNISIENYISFVKKMVWSDFMGITVWMALTTFSLVSRTEIGVNNIPILELIMAILAIIGVKVAHMKFNNIKISQLLTIVIETIFLFGLIYILIFKNDLILAGYAIYSIILINQITGRVADEAFRSYEQKMFKTSGKARFLKVMRNRNKTYILVGSAIGSIIAVTFITIMKVELSSFALCIIILNVFQNGYDYYLWNKYLR